MLSTNCKSIVVMTDSDHKAYHYHPLKKKITIITNAMDQRVLLIFYIQLILT